jgi:hypothetical protein
MRFGIWNQVQRLQPSYGRSRAHRSFQIGQRDGDTSAGVLAGIPTGGIFRTDSIRQDVDMVTARINYHFNWGGPAISRY